MNLQNVERDAVVLRCGPKVRSDVMSRNGNRPAQEFSSGKRLDHRRRKLTTLDAMPML